MNYKIKCINLTILIVFIHCLLLSMIFVPTGMETTYILKENTPESKPIASNYEEFSKGNFTGYEFSSYNLSLYLNEDSSTVEGNLTVDFYNNDPVNFTQLPFHIYPSGMRFDTRAGNMDILNVTTLEEPRQQLDFEVFSGIQLMWVNLTSTLQPTNRTSFIISFNTTLPDGGIDRANEHGWDYNYTRIFKFASAYPQPCVYDEYDGWNIDPYYLVGDPFYYDMAYYDLLINVPEEMKVAATGELLDNTTTAGRSILHYNPHLPVREVTFSASRYFEIESYIIPGIDVNVSCYFLNKSKDLWHEFALDVAIDAINLYHNTFGDYCYSTFNVVQEYTYYGGMEYPLQVYITEFADYYTGSYGREWYLETIIAHETAHQWFYNLLGVDEVDWGFLDEGIVCWVTDWYKDVYHSDWHIFEPYWGLYDVRQYSIEYGLPNKINQSVPECEISGTNYWYIGYTKANTILEKLRQTVGHTAFINSLRSFFREFYFEIADLSDLVEMFEIVTGDSLDWFFYPWFDNAYLPEYDITNAVFDLATNMLTFTIYDINEHLHQYTYSQLIPVQIYRQYSYLEYEELHWINGSTTFTIEVDPLPNRIRLDYSDVEDFVLVQVPNYSIDYFETSNIAIIDSRIPGYDLLVIIFTLSLFAVIVIYKRNYTKTKK